MITAYLALGTNLGDKRLNLSKAIDLIAGRIGVLSASSSIIESEAWGYASSNSYLNMVIAVETKLAPEQLLDETRQIEIDLGRINKTAGSYQDRIIDIDIILYGDIKYKSDRLEIPHPHYRERSFVLDPLLEIFPDRSKE